MSSTPSTIGIREVQETARSFISPDTSIMSNKETEVMTEPLADISMGNTATASKPTTSFKRPASPVKLASKKSTKFDDFDDDDDDDDDLFNFDDDDEEPA